MGHLQHTHGAEPSSHHPGHGGRAESPFPSPLIVLQVSPCPHGHSLLVLVSQVGVSPSLQELGADGSVIPPRCQHQGGLPMLGGNVRCPSAPTVPCHPLPPPTMVPTHSVSGIQEGLMVTEQQHAGGTARGGCRGAMSTQGDGCLGGGQVGLPHISLQCYPAHPSLVWGPPALTSPVQGGSVLPIHMALVGTILGGHDNGQRPSLSWGQDLESCPAPPQPYSHPHPHPCLHPCPNPHACPCPHPYSYHQP